MPRQPLIHTYGLFWKVEDVFWGAGRQPGALRGKLATARRADPIDFRDQRGVYILYADYDLIYIGQNNGQELIKRLKQHRKDDLADRWNRFSWYGLRWVTGKGQLSKYNAAAHVETRDVLNHIEAILIHSVEPRMNRQGGKFGQKIKQYLQVRDDRLGPSNEEMLRTLYDELGAPDS